MKRSYLILCLVAFFSLFAAIPVQAASTPTASLNVLNTNINVGDKFYVEVLANANGSSEALLMFGFDVKTTGTCFSYDGYAIQSAFFDASDPNDPNNVSGMMGIGTAGNNVLLARLSFTALAAGTGSVQVIGCNIHDLYTNPNSSAVPYDPNHVVCDPNHPDQKFYGLMYQSSEYVINGNATANITIGNQTAHPNLVQISGGGYHTVGLKVGGAVVAAGYDDYGQTEVSNWTNVKQVAAGESHTVGLKADPNGTVIAVGRNDSGQCNVAGWANIKQIAAGYRHTVGLRKNGTVVAVGNNSSLQCNVSSWTNIIQVAAGGYHTLGLKANGTVVAASTGMYGVSNVSGWTNIIQVAGGGDHSVGLKADGTVVAVGESSYRQCNVLGWTDIKQIAAGYRHTVGLKKDGTVVAVGSNSSHQCDVSSWTNIIQIAAGEYHTLGLKADGSVVAVGNNSYHQCDLSWNLTPIIVKPGDLNHDGNIDFNDLTILMSAIRKCTGDFEFISEGDYDKDGCITFSDVQKWNDYYSLTIVP